MIQLTKLRGVIFAKKTTLTGCLSLDLLDLMLQLFDAFTLILAVTKEKHLQHVFYLVFNC
jgi:hypothetical protein